MTRVRRPDGNKSASRPLASRTCPEGGCLDQRYVFFFLPPTFRSALRLAILHYEWGSLARARPGRGPVRVAGRPSPALMRRASVSITCHRLSDEWPPRAGRENERAGGPLRETNGRRAERSEVYETRARAKPHERVFSEDSQRSASTKRFAQSRHCTCVRTRVQTPLSVGNPHTQCGEARPGGL